MQDKEIISIAANQAGRRGESLERHAGIEFVGINPDQDGDFESFEPTRAWNEGEEMKAAIAEFTEDGYVYEIFESETERNDFVARAADFGLENEATELAVIDAYIKKNVATTPQPTRKLIVQGASTIYRII